MMFGKKLNSRLLSGSFCFFSPSHKYQECKLYITKTFFKRKIYAQLQINDIFLSTKTTNEMHTDYYDVKSTIYPNCRSFTFTLGLNFNKIHKRYAGNGAGLTEKSRL